MAPGERRTQLAAELNTLLDAVVSIGPHSQRDADAGMLEGAFLAELEHQLNKKTAGLEALNARMGAFSYRFRATNRGLLWLVQLAAADMLASSFTPAPFLDPGHQTIFPPLTLACIAWAVRASIPPKVQPLRHPLPGAAFLFVSTPLRVTLWVGSTAVEADAPGRSLLPPWGNSPSAHVGPRSHFLSHFALLTVTLRVGRTTVGAAPVVARRSNRAPSSRHSRCGLRCQSAAGVLA